MARCKGTLKQVPDSQLSNGYSRAHLKSMFGLASAPATGFKIAVNKHEYDHVAQKYTRGASISGVQRKLLMNLEGDTLVPVETGGRYIVKPAPDGLEHLPENEHTMMNLARAIGFDVPECTLIPFSDGELGFVVKRFDILPTGERLFIEDGASLCNVHPKNKGSDALSYEACLRMMYFAAGKKMPVLVNGFQQVLLAYLMGNNDLHLKNFSMYRLPDTRSTIMEGFTPLYDVLTVFPYPTYHGEYLTLSLLESEVSGDFSPEYNLYGYYTQHDFIRLGTNLGLSERASFEFIKRLTSNIAKQLDAYLAASFMPAVMKAIVNQEIRARIDCMNRPAV